MQVSKSMKDPEGKETPVMHACWHNIHISSPMAAAMLLHTAKETWKGTLICLFQSDEETGGGAQTMVDDDLYDLQEYGKPVPDVALARRDIVLKAGVAALSKGPTLRLVILLKSISLAATYQIQACIFALLRLRAVKLFD